MNRAVFSIVGFFILIVSGCSDASRLEYALSQAKENRKEIRTVLNHYKNDSLKFEAAVFLIENMPYHYGYEGNELDILFSFYKSASMSELSPSKISDSIINRGIDFNFNQLTKVSDITNIKADFLIDHIDFAFDIWRKQPWCKKIDFDTFCHHLLPYRVGNEKLKPWLRDIHNRFDPLLDSIRASPDSSNIIKVTEALIANLQKIRRNYGHGLPTGISIGPDNTLWMAGDCREFTDIQTYIMRAVGLPGGCDKMPMNGNYFLPHFWNYIIDEHGDTNYCSVLFKTPYAKRSTDYPGPKGKIMREKFELNKEYEIRMDGYSDIEKIYPDFHYFTDEDVTSIYSGDSIQTIVIPINQCFDIPKEDEYIYACLSSHLDWVPVDVVIRDGDNLVLKDIDGDVVMRLGVYRAGLLHFISYPFNIPKKNKNIKFYIPQDIHEKVCLLYKFDDIFRENFSDGMVGGVMEGSDFSDFNTKDTLHVIRKAPDRLYTKVKSSSRKSYRYVRYYGPEGGKCYVSEVTFIGHESGKDVNEILSGECIGTPNLQSDNKYPYTNVVDGDPYTSFVYEKVSGGWVGLDLGKPMHVDSIIFTPRNRRNFIEAGDEYELFYCDKRWQSLGRKIASSDSILFTAPKGALLYLRNYSQGTQERIFEYVDGNQVFW